MSSEIDLVTISPKLTIRNYQEQAKELRGGTMLSLKYTTYMDAILGVCRHVSILISTLVYDFYCIGRGKLRNFKIQNVTALLEYFKFSI